MAGFSHHVAWNSGSTEVVWGLQVVSWVGGNRYPIQPEQCQLLPTRLTGGRPSLFMLSFCLRKDLFLEEGGGEGTGGRGSKMKTKRKRTKKESKA